MTDVPKILFLLEQIAGRFGESSLECAAMREVTDALKIVWGKDTRAKFELFLAKADLPLNDEEKQNLEEMGIELSDIPDQPTPEDISELEADWEKQTAMRYPVGSDEYEASMNSFRGITLPNLKKSRVLEEIAKEYGENSDEYVALYRAAYADIFLKNEKANFKWRKYIESLGRELTDAEKRQFRLMGLEFDWQSN